MNSIDVLKDMKSKVNHMEYRGKYVPKERGEALQNGILALKKLKRLKKEIENMKGKN